MYRPAAGSRAISSSGASITLERVAAFVHPQRQASSLALTAKPELVCPVEVFRRSLLPVGRIDLAVEVPGCSDSGFALGRTQREQRYLRRTVEPEGDTDGAEAAIDVKLQIAEAKPAFDILAAKPRKSQRSGEWQANLASVGVAAQHERYRFAGRKRPQSVGVVRRMTQEDDGLVRHTANGSGDGCAGIGIAGHGIVEPGEPESATCAFDGQICVVEHGDAVR